MERHILILRYHIGNSSGFNTGIHFFDFPKKGLKMATVQQEIDAFFRKKSFLSTVSVDSYSVIRLGDEQQLF